MKLYLTNPTPLFGKQQNRKLFTLFGKLILQYIQIIRSPNASTKLVLVIFGWLTTTGI